MRTMTLLLVIAAIVQGQGREGGRFSLQGDPATCMAIDGTSKHALIAFNSGSVSVFPTEQKLVNLYSHSLHKKPIAAAAFLPDGKSFATASADGTLKIWDTSKAAAHRKEMEDSNGEVKPEVPKPFFSVVTQSSMTSLAISADGKTLATGSTDGNVRLWSSELKPIATLTAAHRGGTKSVQFSPDGKTLASGGNDKTAKLWDVTVEKPTLLHELVGQEGIVTSVAFSPDGKHLAVGTGIAKKLGSIHVWEVATAKPAYKLAGHEDLVTCLVFHPKTNHLASGGADKKIRIWELKEKTEQYVDEHPEPLANIIIATDGVRFGSCSALTVRWWRGFGKPN